MFSLAVALGSSEGDVIDADCLRKFQNDMIFNRLKSLYVYVARDAGGEARFSWALTSQWSEKSTDEVFAAVQARRRQARR